MQRRYNLVNESILNEIERKVLLLKALYTPLNGLAKYFKSESLRHSVSLEIDGFEGNDGRTRREKAKEKSLCEKFLDEALDWGLQDYREYLSKDYLQTLGTMIDPRPKNQGSKKNQGGFRGDRDFVRIVGANWDTVSPQLLDREIDFFSFDNYLVQNSVEKSVHAHFHILRIHPLNDGNGRLARAVGNIILMKNRFLPISVVLEEKTEYASLINSAASSYIKRNSQKPESIKRQQEKVLHGLEIDRYDTLSHPYYRSCALNVARYNMTPEQSEFYNFLALKVRDSINDASRKLVEEQRSGITRKLISNLLRRLQK